MIRFGGLVAALLLLSACQTVYNSAIKYSASAIRVGDDKSRVQGMLGTAVETRNQGTKEAWLYCNTTNGFDEFLTVVFIDGKVAGKEEYSGLSFMNCAEVFRDVAWEKYGDDAGTGQKPVKVLATQSSILASNQREPEPSSVGFFINAAGYMVSTHKSISACGNMRVEGYGDAKLIAVDADKDLAILKTSDTSRAYAILRGGQAPDFGESAAYFDMISAEQQLSANKLEMGSLSMPASQQQSDDWHFLSVDQGPKSNGNALLDQNGRVIGILSSGERKALKSSVIRNFLRSSNVDHYIGASERGYSADEIADLARGFSAKIHCS